MRKIFYYLHNTKRHGWRESPHKMPTNSSVEHWTGFLVTTTEKRTAVTKRDPWLVWEWVMLFRCQPVQTFVPDTREAHDRSEGASKHPAGVPGSRSETAGRDSLRPGRTENLNIYSHSRLIWIQDFFELVLSSKIWTVLILLPNMFLDFCSTCPGCRLLKKPHRNRRAVLPVGSRLR